MLTFYLLSILAKIEIWEIKVMKKIYLFSFFLYFSKNSLSQENQFSQASIYKIHKSFILIKNAFIVEPEIKFSPVYIKYPFVTRHIDLYGPVLNMNVFKSDNIPNGSYALLIYDSSKVDQNIFPIDSVEIQIKSGEKLLEDWKKIDRLPQNNFQYASQGAKNNFVIYNDTVPENNILKISFRNGITKEKIIDFDFKRNPYLIKPFVAETIEDSTSMHSLSDFISSVLMESNQRFEAINSFYQYWPEKYSAIIRNEKVFETSKIALLFRKPFQFFNDSSLEYKLISPDKKDVGWKTTGHIIFLSGFKSGKQYRLLVRYKSTPENIWEASYYVSPKWYQTNNSKIIIIAIASVLILIICVLFYKRLAKKETERKNKLALELKSIRSQLNPHFIFNSLSSIQGLINKNEIGNANKYLSDFAMLMRSTLTTSDKNNNTIDEEIKTLDNYLQLEQLRFRFQYKIDTNKITNTSTIEIPSLFLQPLVENAVKHGVSALQENGKIEIQFLQENKNLAILISDNGTGFDDTEKNNGYGLKLTKDRIALLNEMTRTQQIKMQIKQNNGTTVILTFENWLA